MIFDPVDRTLRFLDGEREVISNAGKLVNFLPSQFDFVDTINVVFPDFIKDYVYNWNWINDTFANPVGDNITAEDNACSTNITAVPQEWSDETVLAAAPAGADIFAARVRINRINDPSHSWGGSPLSVLPPENQWIPFSGSVLVEAEIGMARAFSLYLDSGNLVLHRQQSVGTYSGGYGYYGEEPHVPFGGQATGGENLYGSQRGISIAPRDLKNSPASEYEWSGMFPFGVPAAKTNHRRGGVDACATSDITDYSSTYQVEIVGKFGRRS